MQHHTKKPDVDNLVKAVKDALKGLLYQDDAQIIHLEASKAYGPEPGVTIALEALAPDPPPPQEAPRR